MKTIGDIILQHSNRGMLELSKLYPFVKNSPSKAAKELLKLEKGVIFVYTGFYTANTAETDGPLGAYFLSEALKDIGFTPILLTDKYCKDFFPNIQTIYAPIGKNPKNYYQKLLDSYKPIAHISIERCGKNRENKYLNHKNIDIGSYTADLDELFVMGSKTALSIAVGDGGNEIGMGNFKDFFEKRGDIFYSKITCDIPIVASVSNWGAYAIIASLDKKLIPAFEKTEKYLEYILSKGAVDGITGKKQKSVDNKDWVLEKEILSLLKNSNLK